MTLSTTFDVNTQNLSEAENLGGGGGALLADYTAGQHIVNIYISKE